MEREAYLYRNVKEDKIECLTCQRRCIISEGKSGWCHTRVNKGGKLYSLIYGEVSSLSINPIEKKNDSGKELRGIALWIKNTLGPETPWHVTRFYPQLELSHLPPTPIAVLERAWSIGKEEGLWYVYVGNVPGHQWENTYCHICGELLIERYVFDIVTNKINGGKCSHCGSTIPGKFPDV